MSQVGPSHLLRRTSEPGRTWELLCSPAHLELLAFVPAEITQSFILTQTKNQGRTVLYKEGRFW